MRHKISGLAHGVVRQVSMNGDIREFTCKHDTKDAFAYHGLCRWIWGNEVVVSLYKDDEEMASFRFDYNLDETERYDPH